MEFCSGHTFLDGIVWSRIYVSENIGPAVTGSAGPASLSMCDLVRFRNLTSEQTVTQLHRNFHTSLVSRLSIQLYVG